MLKHIKVYLTYYDIGEQDVISCENCPHSGRIDRGGFDIHHINGRGKGKDVIENLMCLCRKCHDKANTNELSRKELQEIHNRHL